MNNQKFPAILITGATGNIGKELTKQLIERGVPFRALVRKSEDKSKLPSAPSVEWVEGDFADSDSIRRAGQGIERAFLLTNSSEQAEALQNGFADIAKEGGVKHIVKQSQWAASAISPVRFPRYHAAVEEKIKQS